MNTAPPSLRRRRTLAARARSPPARTSARPRPRPTGPAGLVVTPGAKTSSVRAGRGRRRGPRSSPSRRRRRASTVTRALARRGRAPRARCRRGCRRSSPARSAGSPRTGARRARRCSVDAALAGGGRLAEQQRDEHRLLDPLPQAAEQVLGGGGLGAGELDRLLGAAELDEAGDHVQAVRGLVGLRAQRVGERLAPRRARARASRPRCGRAA